MPDTCNESSMVSNPEESQEPQEYITNRKLTNRQQLFITEYKKCRNATKACKLAGYSANAARVIGCRLLAHPKIKKELNIWMDRETRIWSKETFIGKAVGEFEGKNPPAVRVRALEIAGQALGHIGSGSRVQVNVDQRQVNVTNDELSRIRESLRQRALSDTSIKEAPQIIDAEVQTPND